ncbi:MAG TPA: GAF domain-containing protein [Gaiellaceae bacterium]|nr:GAF domain-containing protein [Gaiellaceae bacterium]
MSIWKKADKGLRWYERLGAIVGTTLFVVAGAGVAWVFLRHHKVEAWVPVAVGLPLLILAFVAFAIGRRATTGPPSPSAAKAEVDTAYIRALEQAVAGSEYEKRLLWDVIESIQHALAADEYWQVDQLVERGVLGPARGLLVRERNEDVRLSVLVPADEPPTRWRMRWAAGHRPESVRNYTQEIDQTMAGIAFRRGEFVESANVRTDGRFTPHPKESRPFDSLVSLPLRIGERIVGALTVVSTRSDAFSESDVAFIKLIGAVLDLLLAMEHDFARVGALFEPLTDESEE